MARVYFKVHARDIRKAVREKGTKQIIALSKNPGVMRQIAEQAIKIVNPYVPKKYGSLRQSAYVLQNSKGTNIVWGRRGFGKTVSYAKYQHDADDRFWHRTTPGTTSYWTDELQPGTVGFDKLVKYAEPLVKKEVRRANK